MKQNKVKVCQMCQEKQKGFTRAVQIETYQPYYHLCVYCYTVLKMRQEKKEREFFSEKLSPAPWASLVGVKE